MNRTARYTLLSLFLVLISYLSFSQAPTNDDCNNAISLSSSITCSVTSGNMANAGLSTGFTTSCAGTDRYDVWYKFVAQTTAPTISLSNVLSSFKNPTVELFSGSCGSLTSLGCSLNAYSASGLTIDVTYYIRVLSTSNPVPSSNATFSICITDPGSPSNDDCSSATSLTVGTTNSSGTVWAATASSGAPIGCAAGVPDDDVWYKFTASSVDASITLPVVGADLTTSGIGLQLFSGSCGSLTSIACSTSSITIGTLTPGQTYYIRVYSAGSGSIGISPAGSTFSIRVSTLTNASISTSRMNEVFQQTILSTANALNDPWEVTYGSDGYLWITESKGYKVYRMDPNTGVKTTALDISQGAAGYLTTSEHTSFNVQSSNFSPWPQGGFAGLVLHPKFMDATDPKNYVYVSYIHRLVTNGYADSSGVLYSNRIVRFKYNTSNGHLEEPVSVCDTLPGSNDHNSQRMIAAPVRGTYYLFYASGDMGAGQYNNTYRANKAQNAASYEGKILRLNLEPDNDAGLLDRWIPNDNPQFPGVTGQSAVWVTGIRNNQGFAYATINGIGHLYGSSHGPYSDDEVNIIDSAKNYGHPMVIGYSGDGNYNGSSSGNKKASSSLIIGSESDNAAAMTNYQDPIYSLYAASQSTVYNNYFNNTANSGWPSEAPSGMDIYTHTLIPGWKNSLVLAALKWGRVVRLKLNSGGTGIVSTNGQDTVCYFDSQNRFRDLAFAPDGKNMFVIMDKSPATSGPSTNNPGVVACAGCLFKYTFLGYNNNSSTNKSTIPTSIDITSGITNSLNTATTVTIDGSNNNLWVPITGPDGNIMAEIKANGNNLGVVTSSFYSAGTVREDANKRLYLNRSMTITPQNQPSSTVNVRFYISSAELSALVGATNSQGAGSGVSNVSSLKILKNDDANSTVLTATTSTITPAYAEAFGSNGYVLQGDITSFSSFYFGNPNFGTLPVSSLTFSGLLEENGSSNLKWETTNETNTAYFVVERSIDGNIYTKIGSVNATGGADVKTSYSFIDLNAGMQATPVVYYRLKVFDKDGQYAYSKIISFGLNRNIDVLLFPNPVKQILNIRLNGTDRNPVFVKVMDLNGRVVHSEKANLNQNSNISIDVKHWKPQVYILKVVNSRNEMVSTQKFEKL